jgi:type IV secretory pathway VirB9-like protein
MQLIKQGQVSTQKISQRSQEIIQESRELSLQNMDSKSEELGGAEAKNGDVVQVQPEVSSTVHIQDQSIVATASNVLPQHQKKSVDANYLENFEQLKGRFTHEASSGSESNKKEQVSRSGKKIGEFKLNSNTQSEASPTNRPQSQNAGINLRTVFEQVKSRTEKLDDSYQMNSGVA